MIQWYKSLKITTLTFVAVILYVTGNAQCPSVFDFYGQVNNDPYWYSCSGNNFTFNLSSPDTWDGFSIDWGDGTSQTTGASWSPPTFQTHVYIAAVDTFTVTITETATGCVVTGTVVMEKASSASIQIPVGGLTQACAPQMMEFINSSTNVSETTIFTWDFGDGSPILTFDHTNWLQTIQHTYEVGTVTCETVVTLTAQNYCNTVQGGFSTATFNPIRIWDLDDPSITASATLLCYPDTTVTFTNTTYRNCLFQGNIYQRYEWWNFGDYWNLGHDSIIDWTPWPPTFPRTMHYPGIGTYTVQLLDSNFCGIAPTSIQIQIVPPPVAQIAATPDTVCLGSPITFLQQATGGANVHKWNLDIGAGWMNTGSGNITYVFTSPGTYNVGSMVGISGANGCSDTAWVQVVVLPTPTVNITPNNINGCDSMTVDFNSITTNVTNWNWTFDVAPFSFVGQDPPPIDYDSPGNYNVTLNVSSNNGCSAQATRTARVHSSPIADFNVFNLCQGAVANFNNLSSVTPGDSIYSSLWNFGDGTTSTQFNPSHVYNAIGDFNVTLNVNSQYCSAVDSMMVTVEAAPNANISADVIQGCSPLVVQFINNSDSASVYHWTFSDGFETEVFEPSHTFLNTGNTNTTYMITMSALNAFGCGSVDTMYVTVYPGATASFTDNTNTPGCSPFAAIFNNTSQGATSYLWNFGDGATSNLVSPTHTYINNTGVLANFNVTLIAYNNNGCNDTLVRPIVVYPIANFDFSISGSQGCAPHTVTMPFVSGIQIFNWSFGDGATSPFGVPIHTFQNGSDTTVIYNVTLIGISAFGCIDTATSPVTVFPSPVAQFTANTNSGCGPLDVTFNNISINGGSYLWNYGDGTTSTTTNAFHTHTFTNTGTTVLTRQVTLSITTSNGCSSQYSMNIQIYPEINVDFVEPGVFCSPITVSFSNTSTNTVSYQWDFGNGLQSVSQNPTSFYSNNSGDVIVYDISLVGTSVYGCSDTAHHDVTVNPTPVAGFILDSPAGCAPVAITITNTSINADNISWNYGDGSSSTNADTLHQHIYTNTTNAAQQFNIVLTTSSDEGCSSQFTSTLTIYPDVTAEFNDPASFCSPANVAFSNASVNAQSFQWDFGNGTVSVMTNPTAFYDNTTGDPITFDVMLIATSSFGCTDTIIHDVTVNHAVTSSFSPDVFAGCSPLNVNFTNTSVNADVNNWSYGDGTNSTDASGQHMHTFVNTTGAAQTFNVILSTLTDEGCSAISNITITVYPPAIANFGDPGIHCAPATVAFTNSSVNASTYMWEFGNGAVSAMPNPTSYFTNETGDPLVYDIMLIATSIHGCTDTAHKDLVMNPTPVAEFTPSALSGCSPLTVNFNNTSINADIVNWSYGDGTTSTEASLDHTHTYLNNSNSVMDFVVMLSTSSNEGCTSQASVTIQVYPTVQASFLDPGAHCSPVNVAFQNTSVNGVAYNWDFGNGVQAIMANPTIYFVNTSDTIQVYNVQLLVSSAYGCNVQTTMPLTIYPRPVADFTMSESAACVPSPIEFTNTSTVATIFNWNYGDGQTSQINSAQHTHNFGVPINGATTYTVSLTATTINGCVDTTSAVFSLYPAVVAAFNADTIGCSPFNAFFSNQSVGAVSYQWTFGDAQVSQQTSPSHIYTTGNNNDSDFTATLIAMNNFGCTDTASRVIQVMHTPVAIAQIDTTMGCYPTVATFYNGSIGATTYQWSYGTGQTSTNADLYHDYQYVNVTSNIYTYHISLQAYSDYGCMNSTQLTIDIAPPITASFYSVDHGCSPLPVYFDNTSTGGNNYFWNFGDGDVSSEYEPTHTFFNWGITDTIYTVMYVLYDSFGCTDTAYTNVHVYANPLAAFNATPTVQTWPNATVALENMTVGGTLSSAWNMGNAEFIYETNPAPYTYSAWGNYNIQLTVTNGSCSDTAYQLVQILPPAPHADFEGPAEGCAPLEVAFTNLSENAIASTWAFGDGGTANATDPVYTYYQPGTYSVTLTIIGPNGASDQMTHNQIIHVYPQAHAAFVVTPNNVNVPGDPVYCLNMSQFADSYQWDFGDGNTSTAPNPLYYYQAEGSYSIQLIANNTFNCPDTLTLPDVVHASASGIIDFPNAFSPNTNGSSGGVYDPRSFDNDVFFPINKGVAKYQLQIFNKWGELLFESNDVNRGWDGYYRDELVKQDVYVWKVRATFVDGQNIERSGDVTLIIK